MDVWFKNVKTRNTCKTPRIQNIHVKIQKNTKMVADYKIINVAMDVLFKNVETRNQQFKPSITPFIPTQPIHSSAPFFTVD